MSRKPQPAFASKSMFDVLSTDDVDLEESEDEVEEVAETSTNSATGTSNAPLTKSARKRLAKQNRAAGGSAADKASTTVDRVQESIPSSQQVSDTVSATAEATSKKAAEITKQANGVLAQAVNGASKAVNGVVANGSASLGPVVTAAKDSAKAAVDAVSETAEDLSDSLSPRSIGSSFTKPSSASSANSANGQRKSSFSKPPSTSFAPELPEDLPEPKGNGLPSNRKRKTPTDFVPTGSKAEKSRTDGQTPTKAGVKFEDGVAPGEGREGEKTIAPKANKNMIERTVMTFVMIAGFIVLLCAGHPFMIVLTLVCQTLVYKEVTALFELRDEGKKKTDDGDKWSKTLNWYFFVVTNYFLYGESIIYYFKHIVFVESIFIPFARNHRFISFMLYVVGFVGFVGNLNKQYLRQQFALFCWVHISLLLIVVSSHFLINNILEGLIWFFIPASLVICNDVMAYVCGKAFGRTPLIKLSPKKTVEGFVGAFICTLIFALAWGTFFMRFNYMICPARDLGTNVFSNVTCKPNPVFIWRDYEFSGAARKLLSTVLGRVPPTIPYAPFQIHCLVMATFASLVAPFGGFFASGFKRAFNIKDFGHSIPGHGGMTDRMDCQFMMGMFSYVYYSSLIRIQNASVGSIMQTVVTSLTASEQLELLADLKRFLEGQGLRVKA